MFNNFQAFFYHFLPCKCKHRHKHAFAGQNTQQLFLLDSALGTSSNHNRQDICKSVKERKEKRKVWIWKKKNKRNVKARKGSKETTTERKK